ncbi:methyltransferase [Synechococcus sp. SYN20]|uniref:class I SAM-dependent methyltransferase n=1 Tax=Synechococcus sp. SYN20 TaxID=1050714 RepID=UPI0016489541|nr:class I SAM-dependent methyltransferase [Synechococcus sp. SYN20]QNJ27082.1 methyltransferase [Synechococcus sp. SYN20]
MNEIQESTPVNPEEIAINLHFDYSFYTKSYSDLADLDENSAKTHFVEYGIGEKRFCSSYHFFKEKMPKFVSISIKKFQEYNKTSRNISPLNICELILRHHICGIPSKEDDAFFQSPTKRSSIGKHGEIHPWAAQFNSPTTKVLEIGSRCVSSQAHWKNFFPDVQYTGIDIIDGENVDLVADAHKLSDYFEEESFDLVLSFAVFEHLAMPWVVAEEISKVLKVGGHVAIETHFSFSEHELPWHFFQFNSTALECMFNEVLGFDVIDSGLDSPIVGRFANEAAPNLRGNSVNDLYCHSSIIVRKNKSFNHELFSWRGALSTVVKNTMYPKNTGFSRDWKAPND